MALVTLFNIELIITLFFTIAISYVFVTVGEKIKIPQVVALITCGLILNLPLIKSTFIEPNTDIMFILGDIALLTLMFIGGLESSWVTMWKERKDAVLISTFASVIPLILGFGVSMLLGFSFIVSVIVGICISITAEGTTAKLLMDMKKLKTKVGSALMSAGIIDDVLGLSLFVLVTYLLKKAYVKEDLFISAAILAFFIGVITQKASSRENVFIKYLRKTLNYLIVPFFFIAIGFHFNMESLIFNPLVLIILLIIAIIGKLLGTFIVKPFTKFKWRQLHLIGWGMNSRGAVGMALALIAFRSKLIAVNLYSSLLIITLITTVIFPFVMEYMIKKDPRVMSQ